MKGKVTQFIISLAISIGALWLAFRNMEWEAFREAVASGDILFISLGSVVLLASIPLRGIRWRIFMEPVSKVSVRLTSEATIVGYFGNNVLPFRLGELLRSYIVARQISAPVSQVFGTVIVDRVVDFLTALVLIAGLPFIGAVPESLRQPVILVVGISIGMAAVTVWLARREAGIPFLSGRLKSLADNLYLGFTSLRHGRHYLVLAVTTLVLWFLYLLSIHVTQYAMGLGLSLADSYLVLVIVTLTLMVPAAPGYVGTYHAAAVLALNGIFAVDLPRAQATAVVLHAISYIPYTIIGAIFYLRAHVRIREVRAQEWESDGSAEG